MLASYGSRDCLPFGHFNNRIMLRILRIARVASLFPSAIYRARASTWQSIYNYKERNKTIAAWKNNDKNSQHEIITTSKQRLKKRLVDAAHTSFNATSISQFLSANTARNTRTKKAHCVGLNVMLSLCNLAHASSPMYCDDNCNSYYDIYDIL